MGWIFPGLLCKLAPAPSLVVVLGQSCRTVFLTKGSFEQDKHTNMSVSLSILASVATVGSATAAQLLAPANDINLPASESASEPLKSLGANSPYFAGEELSSRVAL